MTSLLLILSGLLGFGALAILVWRVIPLVAEVNRTVRTGAESVARIKDAVAGIREIEVRLRDDLNLLSGAAAAWPRAAVLPGEAGRLVRTIRSFGAAMALLTTLRRVQW